MLHSWSARRMLQGLRYSGASLNSCSSSLESPESEKEEFMVSSTLLNTRSCHYILTRSKYLHTLLSSWLKKKTFKKWAHSCHHWGLSVWVLLQVTDVKCGPLTFIHLDFDFKISLLMVQGRLKSLTLVSCYRLIFTWGLARPRKVINIVSFASGRLRKRERKKNRHQIRQWAYWGHILCYRSKVNSRLILNFLCPLAIIIRK